MSSAPNTLAPLIDRIITNPPTFVPARQPNKEVSEKPVGYIVLSKSRKPHNTKSQIPSSTTEVQTENISEESEMKKQPRSMYEAVQAYTGKRFLTKAEKKAERLQKKRKTQEEEREPVPQIAPHEDEDVGEEIAEDGDEDIGKDVNSSSSSSSDYESASEFPDTASEQPDSTSEEPENVQPETKFQTGDENLENDVDDDEDEEDEDFDNEASSEEEEEDSEDSDDSDDSEDSGNESDAEEAEEVEKDTPDSGSASESDDVKSTVKTLPKLVVKEETTPPTSPEDQAERDLSSAIDKQVPSTSIASLLPSEFLQINENPNDRGSNGSSRIYKNWRELSNKKPVGLLNHGVTCYMNSAIQAMLHIPAVQHYLDDIHLGKHNKTLKPRSVSHVLSELSRRMWGLEDNSSVSGSPQSVKKSSPKYINPKKIIQRLDDINCMMSEWQQEDSHEYYMSLMSRLQEDSTPKGAKLNESIIYDIFGGLLHQSVTCKNCGKISNTKQEFYDLSLGLNKKKQQQHHHHQHHQSTNGQTESSQGITQGQGQEGPKDVATGNQTSTDTKNQITSQSQQQNQQSQQASALPPQKYSIEKSIKDFFSSELIKVDKKDTSSGYVCENCKERTNAIKVSTIDRAPEALTVHLKRFKFNGNASSKMKQPVSYPKYLDLTQFSSTNSPIKYQLTSVIIHEGRSISSGHYVSHCLQPDGTWANYDDEYINKISEREVLKDPSAYFLVYTRLTHKSLSKRSLEASSGKGNGSNKRRRQK